MAEQSGWYMSGLELLGIPHHTATGKDLYDQGSSSNFSSPSPSCTTPIILSASSYPTFGAMVDGQQPDKSGRPRRKNVSTRAKKTSDGLPKKRGRPQKDTNVATPTEKRRTQIRLAQRAYRSRQEATMSQMKNRIQELESVIETMTETFIAFSDTLMQSSMLASSPGIAQSLQEATAKYVELSNRVNPVGEEDDNSDAAAAAAATAAATRLYERPSPPATASMMASPESSTARSNDPSEPSPLANADTGTSPPRNDALQIFDGSPPHITFPSVYQNNLGPLMSHLYGPQSPFFAERLHWACSERAYQYLINPNIADARLTRAFGYLFSRMSRAQVVSFFGTVLSSFGAPEAFDQFHIPMLNLGGAGLHYPRKLPLAATPHLLSPLPAGEQIEALYENAFTARDFEEVWFDSEDLEGFLEEHGVILGSRDTVPEVIPGGPLEVMKATRLSIVSSVLESTSRPNAQRFLSQSPILAVDESQLIDWLSVRGICLGRAAGFRKRDVESFLLQHAWPVVTPQFPL
ncbi:bZIP transcription factor [Aspergillus clavatus NRRL 1]|uniref:BZIP transcription factor n=1 Tax=Aspergillus clavatus (strain ATCC 1007 / CBS 513.65 / DSM 816 / NCTC 3887 / NRRL 1 / QM 1276 / 107) TaxID=344612 RepID=A1CC94_ASPCL|nr:uncharacterized protein ACLA_061120 [Aspergillus clavatus NRRL 1]EAW12151.1 conserved hypothetical protein [Aspergillus clavatus NRRL 1]